ncbi:hypothetical protein [Streptomyces mobaraensis]|uniref:DUF2637 domain-containing protein n=1 Tax=Streptomyces mobaraensis TaxID=35621 RepID=A0A5N5VXN5_STRMB|nr:hypothetical protein [Streptomyces mobaraensis]KAB7833547.1 hypothetical protein FRZ00_33420 [Streptomyces mobaraensis]
MGHKVDWAGLPARIIEGTPAWALAVTAGAVLVTLLLVGYLTWSRLTARQAQRELHRRELLTLQAQGKPLPAEPLRMDPKPLLGGIAVSLYGLWGFARGTLDLPMFFAVGFVSMFDVLELRLFSLMYKSATRDQGWTPQLRLLQATAWAFVGASALANIAHAPNAVAAPFMALMPIGAAWVIELDLRRALAGKQVEETAQQGTKPGPFRLAGLLWRRLWAWGFRKSGLDVTDRADEMVRRARARDAADASYALRKALKEQERLEEVLQDAPVSRGKGKVSPERKQLTVLNRELEKKIRPKAQAALEMADTQDPEQGLQLMQRMAWLTRADDVALLDYGPDSPAMELLEELNIAANAEFIKSRKRAQEEEKKAADAEAASKEAVAEREVAEKRLEELKKALEEAGKEAEETARKAAEEREAEEKRLKALREERALLESSDATSAQLYQKTAEELEGLKNQLAGLQKERSQLGDSYAQLQKQAQEASEKALRLEGEHETLRVRLERLQDERTRFENEAREAAKKAQEARDEAEAAGKELARLQEELLAKRPVPARSGGVPKVRATLDADTKKQEDPTRAQVADIYRNLPEDKKALRGRSLAREIADASDGVLKMETVRKSHISDELLAEYDQRPGVPGPREEADAPQDTGQ